MTGRNPSRWELLSLLVRQPLLAQRYFAFNGKSFAYLRKRYNITFANERTVEIPIVKQFLSQGLKVLEVGNVLNHYYRFPHDVVDKYEVAEGVINEDICSFSTTERYDLIISISTLEHVGWDEEIKNVRGFRLALANMMAHLAVGGKMICTLPIGWNPHVDMAIRVGGLFKEIYALKRISDLNEWVQTDVSDALSCEFYSRFPFANAIVVCVEHKDHTSVSVE